MSDKPAFNENEFAADLMALTNIIWNEAIEAAAKMLETDFIYYPGSPDIRDAIRKLKKP